MGGLFGGGDKPASPTITPDPPTLSDTQIKSKKKADQTRRRRGIEDQALSLGRSGASTPNQPASLLGQVGTP